MFLQELNNDHEASLFLTSLEEWKHEPQVLTYGAILICRKGNAVLNINYKDWNLPEKAVITLFPNDVVLLKTPPSPTAFEVEMLKYDTSLLREASLQMEHTVYSSLREDRCRQDSPVVTNIIDAMFSLLKIYFRQAECTCLSQLVLCQLKAFFIGFHEYLQRNPQFRADEVKSYRVRELFNRFMMLMERDYKTSRDVGYYAKNEHLAEISHQHRQDCDCTYAKDHHRPIHHPATENAAQAHQSEHQGIGLGISFHGRKLLLPLFQEAHRTDSTADQRVMMRFSL